MYFTREGFYDASTQVFPPQFSQIRSRGRRSRQPAGLFAARSRRCSPHRHGMPNSARPGAGHPAGGASRLVWHPLRRFHRRGRPLDSPAGPRPLGRCQRLHRPRRGGVPVQHLRPGHRRLPQIRRLHHGKGQQTARHRLPAQRRQSGRLRAGASGRISGRAAGLCLRGAGIPAGAVRLQLPARVLLRPGGNGQFCPAGHGQGAGLGAGQYRVVRRRPAEHHGPGLCSRRAGRNGSAGQSPVCGPVPESHLYFRRHDLRG